MVLADKLAIAGLVVSVTGFIVAYVTLRKGNENSSAALSLTMTEMCRDAWARYIDAEEDRKALQFGDMMNVFEVGATLYYQGSFAGITKKMQEHYFKDVFKYLAEDLSKRDEVKDLSEKPSTFEHCKKFCEQFRINLFHH